MFGRAIQSFGAEGLSQDTPLACWAANIRILRFVDVSIYILRSKFHLLIVKFLKGPDGVHIQQIGQRELKRVPRLNALTAEIKEKEEALWARTGTAKSNL